MSALGLGLAAPFALRLSRVALAQPTPPPKRLLLFYMPHGVAPEHFNPVVAGDGSFALNQSGESILGPLEAKLKPYTTVVQGLSYRDAGTHEGAVSILSDLPSSVAATDSSAARTTVEHFIGSKLGITPLVLGACAHGPYGQEAQAKLIWNGQPVVPEASPLAAYDSVFAGLGSTPTDTPNPDIALNQALNDLTAKQVSSLKLELTALTHEQTKLQTHLDSVLALKDSGSSPGIISCDAKPVLPAVEALRAAAAGQAADFFLRDENLEAVMTAQLQVAAHAMRCNARSIVAVQTLFATSNVDFGFMGEVGAHHNTLSHSALPGGDQQLGTVDLTTRAPFARAQRWFAEQLVANVLETLLEPDPADPTHSVLDNSIVYWFSEVGDGQGHNKVSQRVRLDWYPPAGPIAYVPCVLIGKGGGTLAGGRVVTVEPDRPHQDLQLALCQAMGTGATSFGESSSALQQVLA